MKRENGSISRVMNKNEIAREIIKSLRPQPERWSIGEHYAICGALYLWVANRPYADCTIGNACIGNPWTRHKIRKLIDAVRWDRAVKQMQESQQEIDAEVKKMLQDGA
jgi:hypothetical protein